MNKFTPNRQLTVTPSESVLLDKGVIRRIYERRVRLAKGRKPTEAQKESASVFDVLRRRSQICITHQTANILRTRPQRFASALLAFTIELQKGPYHRRWARRLRELSFSREDAVVLAYGNFGVNSVSNPVTVQTVVTTDQKLVANYNYRQAEIESRFMQMTQNLAEPYSKLKLPEVLSVASYLELH